MADANVQQMPQAPPNTTGAPGYENGQGAAGNPSHMPPPPLHIPQNTNPIPTAITSPMGGTGDKIMSPGSGGPFGRRSAPEPNKRALYVGGLDPRVTEDVLRQIFETTGHVQSVKIIPDKNVSPASASSSPWCPLCRPMSCPLNRPSNFADTRMSYLHFLNRPKASTMALSSMTIRARPSAPCRH